MLKQSVRDYLSEVGQRGGRVRTPAKLQAVRANLAKARAAKARKCVVTITNKDLDSGQ